MFQMDAARELDKLTAGFLAGFYRVGEPSGSAVPLLDPLLENVDHSNIQLLYK